MGENGKLTYINVFVTAFMVTSKKPEKVREFFQSSLKFCEKKGEFASIMGNLDSKIGM